MSPRAVAMQPEWLPHSFNEDGSLIAAIHVPREQQDKLTFLNDQYFQNRFPVAIHPRSDIESLATAAPRAPLHFIFHTAFCCSTLLVKALDLQGRVTGFKEPIVLNDLALRPIGQDGGLHEELLQLTLRLLARPFDGDGAVVVKAANVTNRIVAPILDASPQSRAVLLYSDLPTLLLAVARHGANRRVWARQLYQGLAEWTSLEFARDTSAILKKPDLQVAALAWLMQIQHFDTVAKTFGKERIMILDSSDFLARPATTLESVSDFLSLGFDSAIVEAIVNGPVFRSHSKTIGASYNSEDRQRDQALAAKAHGREVEAATAWLRSTAGQFDLTLSPSFAD